MVGTILSIAKHKAEFNKLSEKQKMELEDDLSLAIAQTRMEFDVKLPDVISIRTPLVINDQLTSDAVLRAMSDVVDATIVARHAFVLNLNRLLGI
jgi:hypothetical protein